MDLGSPGVWAHAQHLAQEQVVIGQVFHSMPVRAQSQADHAQDEDLPQVHAGASGLLLAAQDVGFQERQDVCFQRGMHPDPLETSQDGRQLVAALERQKDLLDGNDLEVRFGIEALAHRFGLRMYIAHVCSLYASKIFANLRSANPKDPNPTSPARSHAPGDLDPPVPKAGASTRGLLPAQLHLSDEESHRIRAQARGRDGPQRDRGLPALQETHRSMDRSGPAPLPVADAIDTVRLPIHRPPGGLQIECSAPKPQKPWKSPASHRPLNQHSPAAFKESARISTSNARY